MARVLILDDEPLIAMMLEDWLRELAHDPVGPVATEQAALDAVGSNPIDAAILDVSLNGRPSYGVAEELQRRGIPFAFATGYGAGQLDGRFPDAPTLAKPFDLAQVESVMAQLLPPAG